MPQSETPQRIGRFRIERVLGRGAMGVVYQAQDEAIGRWVALKRVQIQAAPTEQARERMRERVRRESRAAGILNHPGIVTIYDAWDQDDASFIAMEYVEGPNLHQRLRRGPPLTVQQVLELAGQIADALDYAHGRGIVHRDLKPGNILLAAGGQAKVADFGVAKIVNATITEQGAILGTLHYLSPEQVMGRPLDGRSDLFSFGVILYELLSGRRPFSGADLNESMVAIVQSRPAPASAVNPALPPQLDAVLERALAKEPEQRFSSGAELVAALRAALQGSAIGSQTVLMSHWAASDTSSARWEEIHMGPGLQRPAPARSDADDLAVELLDRGAETPFVEKRRGWLGPLLLGASLVVVLVGLIWLIGTRGSQPDSGSDEPAPGAGMLAAPEPPADPSAYPLRIESEPEGAEVLLNGEPTGLTTPAELTVDLTKEPKLALRLEDHLEVERALGPDPPEPLLRVVLERKPEPAQIRTDGAYAVSVYSGASRLAQLAPGASLSLEPGAYTLTFAQPSYGLRQEQRLDLAPGAVQVIVLPRLARRTFKAFPEYCDIFLDGVSIGRPPQFDHPVAPGRHRIRFVWLNGGVSEQTIEVAPGSDGEIIGRPPSGGG